MKNGAQPHTTCHIVTSHPPPFPAYHSHDDRYNSHCFEVDFCLSGKIAVFGQKYTGGYARGDLPVAIDAGYHKRMIQPLILHGNVAMNTTKIPEHSLTPTDTKQKDICPFLHRPFPDCRCINMTSLDIPYVLEYCNGNQQECEIYLHNNPGRQKLAVSQKNQKTRRFWIITS